MVTLACPRCDKALDAIESAASEGSFVCTACRLSFPVLGGVPFVWADPGTALADWRNRWNFALAELEAEITDAQRGAALPSTQQRLDAYAGHLTRYRSELREILGPLDMSDAAAKETHLALRTRLPRHHHILSYAQNIHRDWCWGQEENGLTLATVVASVTAAAIDPPRPERILVLGAGAGRLAYDLHRRFSPVETYALDSNPFLCLIGSQVSNGMKIPLTELPLAPRTVEDAAVARELSAPEATGGLHFICADALRPPFAAETFDLVVTPWLIDVVDAPVDVLAGQIARVTRKDGHWLNHGSLAFTGRPQDRLTAPEVMELIQNKGFEPKDTRETQLPYLHSPASRQHRNETTHTFTARLVAPPTKKDFSRHKHLPDWIVTGTAPIPLSPTFQTQITTTRIHAFIMSLIDGKRSINDMAKALEDQGLMRRADAVAAIRNFVTTMYEEAGGSRTDR